MAFNFSKIEMSHAVQRKQPQPFVERPVATPLESA